MKKYLPIPAMVWLLATAPSPFTAQAATDDEISVAGGQFFGLLVKHDFPAAEEQFDSTMKAALPEAKLQELWQTLLKQAGEFDRQQGTRVEATGAY